MNIRNRIKELRRVKASDLRPNPRNWRTHPQKQQDALRGVLAEIGYVDAVIARELSDGTLELVDGHLRAETTPDMEVPVLVTDLDEAEAAVVLATLDPLAALAETDAGKLDALLRERALIRPPALNAGERRRSTPVSESTIIAWTDHTFNPWMGCEKVSAGCAHCYAESLTKNRMGLSLWGHGGKRQVTKAPWQNVRKWNRDAIAAGERRRVFCASLCDVFEDHPVANSTRQRLWDLIRECDGLDWQLLTKRPERIADELPAGWDGGWDHVWLGTSIEDNRVACRADHLRIIPAAVRFVSYEPALGPLDELDLTGIDWLIVGGESGPGYRPFDLQWARDLRQRCNDEGVAFFFKQSAAIRTEMGITLDGEIQREYPTPRTKATTQ